MSDQARDSLLKFIEDVETIRVYNLKLMADDDQAGKADVDGLSVRRSKIVLNCVSLSEKLVMDLVRLDPVSTFSGEVGPIWEAFLDVPELRAFLVQGRIIAKVFEALQRKQKEIENER